MLRNRIMMATRTLAGVKKYRIDPMRPRRSWASGTLSKFLNYDTEKFETGSGEDRARNLVAKWGYKRDRKMPSVSDQIENERIQPTGDSDHLFYFTV